MFAAAQVIPAYDYRDIQTDEIVELVRPMSQATPIGDVIEVDGRKLRRVANISTQASAAIAFSHLYPYVSQSVEPGWPGTKPAPGGGTIIPSPKAEREIMARSRDGRGAPIVRI